MKFKAMVLALAAAMATAWTAAADAAYQGPGGGGSSTLIFSAWDPVSGASYTRDTGETFSSFTPGTAPSITIDLAADSNYTTFTNAVTAAGGSLIWNVASGTVGASGGFGLDATSSVDLNPGDVSNASTGNAVLNLGKFINLLNANCSFSVTGSCVTTNSANSWNINNSSSNWDNLLGGVMPNDTTAGLGGSLKFYNLTATNQSVATASTITLVGTGINPEVFALSNSGELTWNVSPVPEPSSWILFGAGVAMVGAIARRRMSQQ